MEKFRLEIKNRSKKITLAASLIFLIYVYLSRKIGVPDAINDLAAGYNLGLLIALQVGAIYFITKYNKALKNKAQLKKLYIEKHDERKELIQYKSSALGISIFIFILLLATIISGFYNLVVFYTLLGVCLIILAILVLTKLYFLKKL
jgi:ABC-type multidrug transport system permease subunit